jgi:hypothetical protein
MEITKGHFTHETESPWPWHLMHSNWWKKVERVQVRFTLRLRDQRSTWMQDGCKSLHGIKWTMCHGHLDCSQKLLLGGRSNTKPGDHGTLNAHNRWFILFYHVWGPTWMKIHRNSIWLRARSHMASHYTWGPVTTLHDFGGVLGRPLDTFLWALTISWSRLLARVWSGPKLIRAASHPRTQPLS